MKNITNFSFKETANTVTTVLPFALSMAICMGAGSFAGAVFACIAALAGCTVDEKKRTPFYVSFLIIAYAFREFGASTASLSIIFCGIFLIISALFFEKAKAKLASTTENPAFGTVMLITALTVTVLFTTDYFGIGAVGNTVREIIKSYLSLGFHPNWRGVLYGTIVMVVMITFPRKFKKATAVINAAFIALIITTALNYLLNPADMITAIREIGKLSFTEYKNDILLPVINSKPSILQAVICGLSLYLTSFYMLLNSDTCKKSDFIVNGVSNFVSGFVTCTPMPFKLKKINLLNGIAASLVIGIIFFVFRDFIARIPVHSCAVVLIVGAWQSVKWSEVKKAFSSAINIFIFIAITILGLSNGFELIPLYALTAIYIKKNNQAI